MYLYLKYLPQRPQQNCLTFDWTRWWSRSSRAVQKHFEHSLQTYGFTPSWRRSECSFRLPRVVNCCWQMSHVNQVPSLYEFSRCLSSWVSLLKQSEQCLHEYGFASVWMTIQLPTVRTVIWSSVAVYTTFMSLQVAGRGETFITQWTLVWFVSCVDSHVFI